MSLQVWLPFVKDIKNQGLKDVYPTLLGTPTWINEGKIGKAMRFGDGGTSSNGVNLDSNLTDVMSEDYSVAVWVKPYGDHFYYNGTIFSSGDWNHEDKYAFGLSQDNSKVDFLCKGYNSWVNCPIPINTWTHLCCVYHDGTGIFYKNGEKVSEQSDRFLNPTSDASNACIGRATYGSGYFTFNGAINDFRLYDHALSPMEVKQISKGLVLHYPLSGIGRENLATNTDFSRNSIEGYLGYKAVEYNHSDWTSGGRFFDGYGYSQLTFTEIQANQPYTISAWVYIYDDVSLSNGASIFYRAYKTKESPTYSYDIAISLNNITERNKWIRLSNTFISPVTYAYDQGGTFSIGGYNGHFLVSIPKVEKGSKATPWCPNSSDALYTALGYDDGIEYDTSGYGNNGTKVGTLSYSIDSPRYLASTVFDGNNSCVRTSNNNWISRPLEEFTVNVWAYKDDWTTYGGQRLFSCTEGAGFNTEQLNSAISFPILVYKNEARTTRGYTDSAYRPLIPLSSISSGWHMFTFTYSTSKISSYLDGILVDSKDYTSYGTYCGDNIPLCIGAEATSNFGTAGGMFVGKMSDFRLYYTCLSAEDIQKLYTVSASIDSNGNAYSAAYVEG